MFSKWVTRSEFIVPTIPPRSNFFSIGSSKKQRKLENEEKLKILFSLDWKKFSRNRLEIEISPENTKKSAKVPAHIPPGCSLHFAFVNSIDIRSAPRKVKSKIFLNLKKRKYFSFSRIFCVCSLMRRPIQMKNVASKNCAAAKAQKTTFVLFSKKIYRCSTFSIIFRVVVPISEF